MVAYDTLVSVFGCTGVVGAGTGITGWIYTTIDVCNLTTSHCTFIMSYSAVVPTDTEASSQAMAASTCWTPSVVSATLMTTVAVLLAATITLSVLGSEGRLTPSSSSSTPTAAPGFTLLQTGGANIGSYHEISNTSFAINGSGSAFAQADTAIGQFLYYNKSIPATSNFTFSATLANFTGSWTNFMFIGLITTTNLSSFLIAGSGGSPTPTVNFYTGVNGAVGLVCAACTTLLETSATGEPFVLSINQNATIGTTTTFDSNPAFITTFNASAVTPPPTYVGMFLTSGDASMNVSALFTNVSLTIA